MNGFACEEHELPAEPGGGRCGRCCARLGRGLPDGFDCPSCREAPPPYAGVVACADYRRGKPAREWLLALKHRGRRDLAEPLGTRLGLRLREAGVESDAWLVPIPLHTWRRLERGYDQAWLLARFAGRRVQRRVVPALVRVRSTAIQGDVGAQSRAANVHRAFALDPAAARGIGGREIWLVDDVMTSGATTAEAARVLRRAGAGSVRVACVARAGAVSCAAP